MLGWFIHVIHPSYHLSIFIVHPSFSFIFPITSSIIFSIHQPFHLLIPPFHNSSYISYSFSPCNISFHFMYHSNLTSHFHFHIHHSFVHSSIHSSSSFSSSSPIIGSQQRTWHHATPQKTRQKNDIIKLMYCINIYSSQQT